MGNIQTGTFVLYRTNHQKVTAKSLTKRIHIVRGGRKKKKSVCDTFTYKVMRGTVHKPNSSVLTLKGASYSTTSTGFFT